MKREEMEALVRSLIEASMEKPMPPIPIKKKLRSVRVGSKELFVYVTEPSYPAAIPSTEPATPTMKETMTMSTAKRTVTTATIASVLEGMKNDEIDNAPVVKRARKPRAKKPYLEGYVKMGEALVHEHTVRVLQAARTLSQMGAFNLLLLGPSGAGKTSIPIEYAKREKMKHVKVNCAAVRDPEEWFGYREAKGGSTVFVPTPLTQAIRGGNVMVVLDEFNRVEPWLHNTLYPMLDHTRETIVHGEKITVGKGTIFAATINLGGQFSGTFVLDAALVNRFDAAVMLGFLPKGVETLLIITRMPAIPEGQAGVLVDLMQKYRGMDLGVDVSTRTTLKIGQLLTAGLDIQTIVGLVIMPFIDDPKKKKEVIDATNTYGEKMKGGA